MAPRKQLRLDHLIRVSKRDGRDGDSFRSPDQQREVGQAWVLANRAEIVAEHESIDVSGKTMLRGDVDAALERVRAGQTDGILVAWLDRFSRAPVKEALKVYDDIKAAGGVVVAADMAGLNPDDPTGEMALTVMLAVGRMQWRKSKDRHDLNRKNAIEDGKAIVRIPPFGYRWKDASPKLNGKGVMDSRLVVYEPERAIVVELFERKAAGATWLELARWMDKVAPKPPGRSWERQTIVGMIRNRKYVGEVVSGEYVKVDAHEPIVTPALWRRAQNKPGRRTPRGTYLLSGLARCAGCGRNLRGSSQGKRAKPIYTCENRNCTARPTLMVNRLDAEVVAQLFVHLDDFHVQAVDDDELAAAHADTEEARGVVERLAAVVPASAAGIAAHQAALTDAERALEVAEDLEHQLLASRKQDGPDARELRSDWPNMTLAEQREILTAGIDRVIVRRAPSPTTRVPTSERVLVLFRGESDGLPAGGAGRTGDEHPGSLVAAA